MPMLEAITIRRRDLFPKVGDLFTYKLRNIHGFGRVVRDDLEMMGFGLCLTYFYGSVSSTTRIPALSPEDLLIPPVLLVKDSWQFGVFKFIRNQPQSEYDVLPHHCFWDFLKKETVNETGDKIICLCKEKSPYGFIGLSYIDSKLSSVLKVVDSEEEYSRIVGNQEFKRVRPSKQISVTISLRHTEIQELGYDIEDLELPLDNIVRKNGLGTSVGAGSSSEYYDFSFELQPKLLAKFKNTIAEFLVAKGFEDYLINEDLP
jgi:hypothetical protein